MQVSDQSNTTLRVVSIFPWGQYRGDAEQEADSDTEDESGNDDSALFAEHSSACSQESESGEPPNKRRKFSKNSPSEACI